MQSLMSAFGRLPVAFEKGLGVRLLDTEGREYLDALSGIAVCALGHANPAIAATLAEQSRQLLHVSNLYNIPAQEALGERLCKVAGMDKAFFCNSGAEANEAAIKIARLHGHARGVDSPRILVADTAFHGRTMATISATGNAKLKKGFGPMLDGFEVIPFNDIKAAREAADACSDIVAVMVEPIQGEGGVNIPDDNYLPALREICDEHGWLLMLDEVQSGMGRTGKWFAYQHSEIKPDVITVAKALGNGFPIGACLAQGAAADLIQPGSHGTTFGGSPLACSVGMTVINEIESGNLVARAAELGERICDGFRQALHNQPNVVDIRNKGLMIGIEFDQDCVEIMNRALDAGLLVNVTAGNVVRLLPPYILTNEEADDIVRCLTDVINDYLVAKDAAVAQD